MPTSVCEVTTQVYDQISSQMVGKCSLTEMLEGWSTLDLLEYGSLGFGVSAAVGLGGYALLWAVRYASQTRANRLRNAASQDGMAFQMGLQNGVNRARK